MVLNVKTVLHRSGLWSSHTIINDWPVSASDPLCRSVLARGCDVCQGQPDNLRSDERVDQGNARRSSGFGSPIIPPPPRLHVQKSSVFSRAHVHLYIINIIALLLYVHYNTGSGEQDVPLEKSAEPQTSSATLSPELSFQLPRLEGIRVGHGQRVSLVPDGTHNMRTLSLKPLLFEIPGFLSVEESPDQLFSQLDLNQDSLLQRHKIVSLSHSTDGSWLSSYSLRKIHTGLETNPSE